MITVFAVIFGLLILQGISYWLCAKQKIQWLDLIVFLFFLVGNAWLFPWLYEKTIAAKPEFSISPLGISGILFFIFGLPGTIILFLVNAYWRKKMENRKSE
jgi:hypothetical protein